MSIFENVKEISESMPKDVTLIAVSKTKSIDEIKMAYDAGVRDFGENKVQELITKIDNLPGDIRWHLIGHLQKNKVKYIIGGVELIHSLDSIELLNEIEKRYSMNNISANTLIQINIGKEESKSGIEVEELDSLIEVCERCNNVKVKGLMAVIPIGNEESCRYYFREMKKIFDELKSKDFKNVHMEVLSMGMTSDYRLAIEEGANMVRVGTGIFGMRDYNNK